MTSDPNDKPSPSSHIIRTTGDAHKARLTRVNSDGAERKAGAAWGRGSSAKLMPTKALLTRPGAIERFVLRGLTPKKPFIDTSTKITAFGSCFADNIARYLNSHHYTVLTKKDIKAYVVALSEGMVNTYAIRQQFEWALENISVNDELWYDKSAEFRRADEEIRLNTRDLFMNTDVFILTFGLSEVWYSKATGDVFWRGVPSSEYDEEKHGFRVVTAEENRANIEKTYQLIRKYRPDSKIIFSLSPIPLLATFRREECMVANSYSKASLRVALDDVFRAHADDPSFFYWPSYEIITEFFPDAFARDRRHPDDAILKHVMRLFEEYFCIPDAAASRAPLIQTLVSAMVAIGLLGPGVRGALRKGDMAAIRAIAAAERQRAKETEKRRLAATKQKNEILAMRLADTKLSHTTMAELLEQAADGFGSPAT